MIAIGVSKYLIYIKSIPTTQELEWYVLGLSQAIHVHVDNRLNNKIEIFLGASG